MNWILKTGIIGTLITAGGATSGYISYKELNKTLEDKIHHVNDGGEHYFEFGESDERSMTLRVKTDEKTADSFKHYTLRLEKDKGKKMSENDLYDIMLKVNRNGMGELTAQEMQEAWQDYWAKK